MKKIIWMILAMHSICQADEICSVSEWEEHVANRYQQDEEYRQFDENSPERVKNFYRLNHKHQTLAFVLRKKEEYATLQKATFSVWDVLEKLDMLVDQSDPDLDIAQIHHAFQTAEAIRKDGGPRWLILTGFIHDLGKVLAFFGEPQWAVVGDTFPVGCKFSEKVVFPEYFMENPDLLIPDYQTETGIYTEGCGLDQVHMSWGHDEYLYQVMKDYLPREALFIIRYHSFYALHREDAYTHLLSESDFSMLPWLKLFSSYDLYSKTDETLDLEALLPYYRELVNEYLPENLEW